MGTEASGHHSTADGKDKSAQRPLLPFNHNPSRLQLNFLCWWYGAHTNGIWHGLWWSPCNPESWIRLSVATFSICPFLDRIIDRWALTVTWHCLSVVCYPIRFEHHNSWVFTYKLQAAILVNFHDICCYVLIGYFPPFSLSMAIMHPLHRLVILENVTRITASCMCGGY